MCGPTFCSMKISQDIRDYAAERGLDSGDAMEEGLARKAEEFRESGGEIYVADVTDS